MAITGVSNYNSVSKSTCASSKKEAAKEYEQRLKDYENNHRSCPGRG